MSSMAARATLARFCAALAGERPAAEISVHVVPAGP